MESLIEIIVREMSNLHWKQWKSQKLVSLLLTNSACLILKAESLNLINDWKRKHKKSLIVICDSPIAIHYNPQVERNINRNIYSFGEQWSNIIIWFGKDFTFRDGSRTKWELPKMKAPTVWSDYLQFITDIVLIYVFIPIFSS